MTDSDAVIARVQALAARMEAVLTARTRALRSAEAELAALRAQRDTAGTAAPDAAAELKALRAEKTALAAECERLRTALAEADAAREADFALRTEAAEALDRAIAELRSMADAG